ncbi:hypothetical protein Pmani_023644 [Petrolisthes manimaculis]|uniref:CN hydrolase domain-containing protein n=1 Tax=Petrolisthes manimaculis TaxID=1843537 RepID=A0AAE1U0V8_9EUCA|nr:hypothetical protein Pmani_023644 [Petrolisthes manimaculis]
MCRTAVLEYAPYSNWDQGGLAILQENARVYLQYAALAKQQGADMLVFPEYGLTSTNLTWGDFLTLTQLVPDPDHHITPCSLTNPTDYTKVLRDLSCGAAELGMYLVVDLAELYPCHDAATTTPSRHSHDLPTTPSRHSHDLPTTPSRHPYDMQEEGDEGGRRVMEEERRREEEEGGTRETEEDEKERQRDEENEDRKRREEEGGTRETDEDKDEQKENKEGSQEEKMSEEEDVVVVVVDDVVCPESGYVTYNTQVVLDRSGKVVARYRKRHLFLEPEFTPGREDVSTAIFKTDFGVTFSLQVCFDIMYEAPALTNVVKAGVRDVVFSTAWIDELPFLTAPQILRGWSAGLGVNLLAANYHQPTRGKLGSGVFPGVKWGRSSYTYDHRHGDNTLVVANLTTITTTTITPSMTTDSNSTTTNQTSSSTSGPKAIEVDSEMSGQMDVNKDRGTEGSDVDIKSGTCCDVEDGSEEGEGDSESEGEREIEVEGESEEERDRDDGTEGESERDDGGYGERERDGESERDSERDDESDGEGRGDDKVSDWSEYPFIQEDLSRYVHTTLLPSTTPTTSASLCHLELCCTLTYSLPHPSSSSSSRVNKMDDDDDSENEGIKEEQDDDNDSDERGMTEGQDDDDSDERGMTKGQDDDDDDDDSEERGMNEGQEDDVSDDEGMNEGQEDEGVYKLVVYSGVVEKGGGVYSMFTQVCSVLHCHSEDVNSCTRIDDENYPTTTTNFRPIQLQGRFSTRYVFPSVLLRDLTLLDEDEWTFTNTATSQNNSVITPYTHQQDANARSQQENKRSGSKTLLDTINNNTSTDIQVTEINNKSPSQADVDTHHQNNTEIDNTRIKRDVDSATSYDCQLSVKGDVNNVLSVVLFGRWYDRDPPQLLGHPLSLQ